MQLQNKNILFIAPRFMDYHKMIKAELDRRGAHVVWMNQQSSSVIDRLRITLDGSRYWQITYDYWHKAMLKNDAHFDVVFILNYGIPIEIVRELRANNPNAAFISYNFDDFAYIGIDDTLLSSGLFDRILTYDVVAAKRHNIIPRPFFYDSEMLIKPNRGG